MRKPQQPRTSHYMGTSESPSHIGETWLEPESLTYPSGGFYRRARVAMPDGSLRIVTCAIPDTFFSIPARLKDKGKTVRGFITSDEDKGFAFTADKD